jgi:hypothetical protein
VDAIHCKWRLIASVLLAVSVAAACGLPAAGATAQRRFASLDDATTALVTALRTGTARRSWGFSAS